MVLGLSATTRPPSLRASSAVANRVKVSILTCKVGSEDNARSTSATAVVLLPVPGPARILPCRVRSCSAARCCSAVREIRSRVSAGTATAAAGPWVWLTVLCSVTGACSGVGYSWQRFDLAYQAPALHAACWQSVRAGALLL